MLITDYFQEIRETIAACDVVHSSNVTYSPSSNLAAVLSEIRGLLPRDLIAASDG